MMLNKLLLIGLLSWWAITTSHNRWRCSAEEGKEQKVFPELLDVGYSQVHIVTESISDEFGYETTEEYVDFKEGKSTLVKTSRTGHSVTYLDAKSNLIYHYKPYECMAMLPEEVEVAGYHGIWNAEVKWNSDDSTKEMRLYGVTAVWFNAGRRPKNYMTASLIYSASKDIYKSAQKWTIKDEPNKNLIHMYFTESSTDRGVDYQLEMIQVESMESKKNIRTVNILSFDRYISREVQNTLLEVPVGYGCMNKDATEKALILFPRLKDSYMGPLLSESHKIELEVTATKFNAEGEQDLSKQMSDTKSVTLARHTVQDTLGGGLLQLIRERDTYRDIKKILHYHYGVEYLIDLRTGECKMSNLGKYDTKEKLVLEFSHGLSVLIDVDMMNLLFVDHEDYFFIKQVDQSASGRSQYLYFERTLSDFLGKPARIVRTYSSVQEKLDLERVTVWTYDTQKTKVLQSYHFNLVETSELKSELSKLFDVSEECYLNNEKMRANRDYAWFQLTYTMATREREVVEQNPMELRSIISNQFLAKGHLSFFRVPKLELMFEQTGFVLRALLIDLPKFSTMFEVAHENVRLADADYTKSMSEVAVDEEHCADLCRLNRCRSFSFCENSHKCAMSTKSYAEVNRQPSNSCTTYTVPQFFYQEDIEELSLHRIISLLQHQEYGALNLPKVPEELTYSRIESGLDENEYKMKKLEYLDEVAKYLEEQEHRLPMLTFSMVVEQALIILLPSRFELENDPLNEFNLGISDESSQDEEPDKMPPFHQGLDMSRYKMSLLTPPATLDGEKAPIAPKARLFSGLNYDQCALACVDSKCSSFSYCVHRQECIITDIYNISSVVKQHVQEDAECFIAQRDFVSKFHKFPGTIRFEWYKKSATAQNPSECAHTCMVEDKFKCRAFSYCPDLGKGKETSCYYFDDWRIFPAAYWPNGMKVDDNQMSCDHYSRSYLADFQRIEYRQVEEVELLKLKTTTLEGHSVDKCAEVCVTEEMDCTAFQFCFNPEVKDGPMQSCTLIESVPQENKQEFEVVVEKSEDGKVVKAGKFFKPNINCHVFSLAKDSSEAQVRDLALSSMTSEELEESKRREKGSRGGLTLGQGLLLYLFLTALFAAIGCGIVFAKHHNDYLRQKMERIQLLLGF